MDPDDALRLPRVRTVRPSRNGDWDSGENTEPRIQSVHHQRRTRGTSRAVSTLLIATLGVGAILSDPYIAGVNAVVIALIAGTAIANMPMNTAIVDLPATEFVLRYGLKAAVILLGAGLSIDMLTSLGWPIIAVIVLNIVLAFLVSTTVGRHVGLNANAAALIAAGTAICGASAIAAIAPILRAKREHIGTALATVVGLNVLAMLAYPIIGKLTSMEDPAFGAWAGLAVHDTASAIATGFTFGPEAGETATIVKLVRTLFLAPVVVVAAAWTWFQRTRSATEDSIATRFAANFPWFVLGFAFLATLNSLDLLLGVGPGLNSIGKELLVFVVAALGLSLRLPNLWSMGRRLLFVGLAASATVGAASIALISWFGVGS